MRTARCRLRPCFLLATIACGLVAAAPARACLAEFRSFDWLVGESALIFVGTIEKVEKVEPGEEDRRFDEPEEDSGPTLATVRISRVLHGNFSAETLRLRSGPVAS